MKLNFKLALLVLTFCCSHFITQAQYITFSHDGIDRQYIYHEPIELDENMPLVFAMHGYTGDAGSMRNYSDMNDLADLYGFAVVYPRGTKDGGGNRFWNVGYDFHPNEDVDDVGFLTELAAYLQVTHGLNPDYTFATGFSNGAEMCYMLACQAYETFKAVAPVAGMILQDILDECDGSTPIPLFEIHGSQDGVTPLSGDPSNQDGWGAYPSIASTIDYFVAKNECTTLVNETLPDTDPSDDSIIVTEKHQNGINNNEVWYYEVVGGGHDWPGAWGNMDIDAGEEAWLFFRMYMDNILSNPSYKSLDKTIRVFPNPAQNMISIENNDPTLAIQDVILYDILGVQIETSLNNGTMDLSHLSSGVYLMTINTSLGVITRRVIKE